MTENKKEYWKMVVGYIRRKPLREEINTNKCRLSRTSLAKTIARCFSKLRVVKRIPILFTDPIEFFLVDFPYLVLLETLKQNARSSVEIQMW